MGPKKINVQAAASHQRLKRTPSSPGYGRVLVEKGSFPKIENLSLAYHVLPTTTTYLLSHNYVLIRDICL